jgi:hypothetical protein
MEPLSNGQVLYLVLTHRHKQEQTLMLLPTGIVNLVQLSQQHQHVLELLQQELRPLQQQELRPLQQQELRLREQQRLQLLRPQPLDQPVHHLTLAVDVVLVLDAVMVAVQALYAHLLQLVVV